MADNTNGTQNISVLNPVGFPPKITPKAMAPRLDSLDGKTIYLVDPRFDDSGLFLRQVQNWFTEHMPSVKTKFVEMIERLHQGRSEDLGDDQGRRRRRHHRCRPLKHLRAGGRRARNRPSIANTVCPPCAITPMSLKRSVQSVNRMHGMPRRVTLSCPNR